jgi:hypothetical protein
VTTAAAGTGSATVGWAVSANGGAGRTGTLTAAGQTFTIVQAGTTCSYALTPTGQTIAASGGGGTFSVATGPGCAWTASANDAWIVLIGGAAGTGQGSVSFTVAPNSGAARTGTITAGGQSFSIAQDAAAPACAFAISAVPMTFPSDGGQGTITIITTAACAWTATSNDGWIDILGRSSGTGSGSFTFSVSRFNGNARTGTMTVAGQTVTITQQK